MKTELIVTSVNHYSMDAGNKGLSVRVVGDHVKTNNKFGLEISEASVSDYDELNYLAQHMDDLPAKFKANISLGVVKTAAGKEKSGVNLKNLEFVNTVEFVDVKTTVKV